MLLTFLSAMNFFIASGLFRFEYRARCLSWFPRVVSVPSDNPLLCRCMRRLAIGVKLQFLGVSDHTLTPVFPQPD